MRTRFLLPTVLLAMTLPAMSDDETSVTSGNTSASAETSTIEQYYYANPNRLWKAIGCKKESGTFSVRLRNFLVSSPIIGGLLPKKNPPDANFGKKVLNLPVVRLLVPGPADEPPGGGKYFAWKSPGTRSWTSIANGAVAADPNNPVTHEPTASIVTVSK